MEDLLADPFSKRMMGTSSSSPAEAFVKESVIIFCNKLIAREAGETMNKAFNLLTT